MPLIRIEYLCPSIDRLLIAHANEVIGRNQYQSSSIIGIKHRLFQQITDLIVYGLRAHDRAPRFRAAVEGAGCLNE